MRTGKLATTEGERLALPFRYFPTPSSHNYPSDYNLAPSIPASLRSALRKPALHYETPQSYRHADGNASVPSPAWIGTLRGLGLSQLIFLRYRSPRVTMP